MSGSERSLGGDRRKSLLRDGDGDRSQLTIQMQRLKVCHNCWISRNKVFEGLAARGKTSVDWFYGFKLHIVV